jgi:hypothetical protein
LSVALATTEPVKAAESSMPSMAMLTTPDRSHSTPDKAPNVIGTDRSSVLCSKPTTLSERSRAAQVRNAITNRNTTTPMTRVVRAPKPRVSWIPARNAQTIDSVIAVAREGTTRSPIEIAVEPDPAWSSWNVVLAPGSAPSAKSVNIATARSRKTMPSTRARVIDTPWVRTTVGETAIRCTPSSGSRALPGAGP